MIVTTRSLASFACQEYFAQNENPDMRVKDGVFSN